MMTDREHKKMIQQARDDYAEFKKRPRTFLDARHGLTYRYHPKTDEVEAVPYEGDTTVEKMSLSLVERLSAQGVPSSLWKGSPGAKLPKIIQSLAD